MATQRSSDVAWEGLIHYKQKSTFMSQYHTFWGRLCRESGRGSKRVELFNEHHSPTPHTPPTTIVPLTDVLHIDSRAARGHKFAFQVLATGSKFHFATKTAAEREHWITHLNNLLFGPPLPGIVYEFQVQVLSNTCADQLQLQGKYILKVTTSELALTYANGELPTRFKCRLAEILRTRYTTFTNAGQRFSVLVIYTKGSSEVGEGTFVFHTLSAADISRVIDHRVQELFQDTLESPSTTLNLSLTSQKFVSLPRAPSPASIQPTTLTSDIPGFGRSKTASVPHKRMMTPVTDNYIHMFPKSRLPLSTVYPSAVPLPLDPWSPTNLQHDPGDYLAPRTPQLESYPEATSEPSGPPALSRSQVAGTEEYNLSEGLEGSAEYVNVQLGMEDGMDLPRADVVEGQGNVEYVNIQLGSNQTQPVQKAAMTKLLKRPVPLPRKKVSVTADQVHTSHNDLVASPGNHGNSDRVTSPGNHSNSNHVTSPDSRGIESHSYMNFTVLDKEDSDEDNDLLQEDSDKEEMYQYRKMTPPREIPEYLKILPPDSLLPSQPDEPPYLQILPQNITPSNDVTDDTLAVQPETCISRFPAAAGSPRDLEELPLSGQSSYSPLWRDQDSPDFESLPFELNTRLESDKPPTTLALLSPPLALKCSHSAENLLAISSLPNRQSIPLHQPLAPLASVHVQRAEFDALTDIHQPMLGRHENLTALQTSADLGTTALMRLGERKCSEEVSQPLKMRPDNLSELFQNSETHSDDGYVDVSDTEIDSYGYSRPKELPLPYSELTSEERDILDGYSRPDCLFAPQHPISTRPPAPLPENVVETRGMRRSIRRGRAHSVGDLSRSSELYEDLDIWYDYDEVRGTLRRKRSIDQVAGYVDVNQQLPSQSEAYDRLPMKSQDSDRPEAIQSDLSKDDLSCLTPHPLCQLDTSEYDRLPSWTADLNRSAQSPSDTSEYDRLPSWTADLNRSAQSPSDRLDQSVADKITMDYSEPEVNDQSENRVSGTDQSDPRTKRIPPRVAPKPRRSNAGIGPETFV